MLKSKYARFHVRSNKMCFNPLRPLRSLRQLNHLSLLICFFKPLSPLNWYQFLQIYCRHFFASQCFYVLKCTLRQEKADVWDRQKMWDRGRETGDVRHTWAVRQETGDGRHNTRNVRQETGDLRQKTWNRRCETGDIRRNLFPLMQKSPFFPCNDFLKAISIWHHFWKI